MTPAALPPDVQAELAKLHDIHLPPPVGWWPLAWGWWGLAGLALATLCGAVWAVRWYLRQPRQLALRELAALRSRKQSAEVATDLAILLRRVAPRHKTAREQDWIAHLTSGKAALTLPIAEFLAKAPYRPTPPEPQLVEAALTEAEGWIRGRA